MNFDEKKEFLEHSIDLARKLEEKTNEIVWVRIGWITTEYDDVLPVDLTLNTDRWFDGWSQNVVMSKIGRFTPVKNPYLALNELIEKVYKKQ